MAWHLACPKPRPWWPAGHPRRWPPTQVASYLRGKDARVVLQTVLAKGLTGSGPIPDGVVVPADPITEISAGHQKVPVLSGYTAEEGKLFAPFLVLLGGKPGMKIGDAERFAMMQRLSLIHI